jgi:hypothetical protein
VELRSQFDSLSLAQSRPDGEVPRNMPAVRLVIGMKVGVPGMKAFTEFAHRRSGISRSGQQSN